MYARPHRGEEPFKTYRGRLGGLRTAARRVVVFKNPARSDSLYIPVKF